MAGEAARGTNEDGSTFCGSTKSRTKGATAQGETKRLDLRDDVETTWRLIDERVSAHRDPRYGQVFTQQLGKEVKKSLAEDRRRRADEVGAEVEALVKADPPLIQEAW